MNDLPDEYRAPVRVTHRTVADKLGLTVAAVSRLRSGSRLPSFDLMWKIQEAYDWSVEEQTRARVDGQWMYAFESVLRRSAQ